MGRVINGFRHSTAFEFVNTIEQLTRIINSRLYSSQRFALERGQIVLIPRMINK